MKRGQFYKKTMNDVPLRGKTVLVRADYNVPLREGKVANDFRIRASLPTLRKLLAEGCKVVIISHLGRPDGVHDAEFSLEPVAQRLAELIERPVRFVDKCIGDKVHMAIKRAPGGSITVLENLRFHPEEEANDMQFAKQLATDSGAQLFVQDGFGVVHRAHASTSAITQYLPGVAGLLLEREWHTITHAMHEPERPLVAVLGGAKVHDKIGVIEALIDIADTIIIGGAMANTFLARTGVFVGKSFAETDQNDTIDAIYDKVVAQVGRQRADAFIVLPTDVGVGNSLSPTATRRDVSVRAIPADGMALDLGPKSVQAIESVIKQARTVIWNGTIGYDSIPAFATGSTALVQALAAQRETTQTIIGGGDTADFVLRWNDHADELFHHISTGGGASLELIAGKKLPGIESLLDAR